MIGTPAACIAWRARVLEPISSIASGRRPDPGQARSLDGTGEAAFSARNPYPGCTALGTRALGRHEELVDDEVALGCGQSPERQSLIGIGGVQRRAIGVRVDGTEEETPSSRRVRKMRTAISPRLATRTF